MNLYRVMKNRKWFITEANGHKKQATVKAESIGQAETLAKQLYGDDVSVEFFVDLSKTISVL